MNKNSHFHHLLSPWTLIGSLVVGGFIAIFSLLMPLNNWHLSILTDTSTFHSFSPIAKVLANLFYKSNVEGAIEQAPVGLNILSALFSITALWLLFAKINQKNQTWGVPLLIILAMGSISFLWVGAFALHHSMFWLGLLLLSHGEAYARRLAAIKPSLFLLYFFAFLLLLGSSLPGLLFVIISLPFGFKSKALVGVKVATAFLAMLVIFLIYPTYFIDLHEYTQWIQYQIFSLNGSYISGAELGWSFSIGKMLGQSSLATLLLTLSALFFGGFRLVDITLSRVSIVCVLLLIIWVPAVGNLGGFDLLFLFPVFAISVIDFLNSERIENLSNKVRWGIVGACLLLSVPSIIQLVDASPYQYLHNNLLGYDIEKQLTDGDGEYLNISGITLLQRELANDESPSITINFEASGITGDKNVSTQGFFAKNKGDWETGIYTLSALHPQQRTSAAFPVPHALRFEKYKNVILAHSANRIAPFDSIYPYWEERKYGEAVSTFKELRNDFSNYPELWVGLATSQYKFHAWDDALKSCEFGLILNSRSAELRCIKGAVFSKQNKGKLALEAWESCIELDSNFARAHWLIGEYHLRNNSLNLARRHFQKATNAPSHVSRRAAKSLQLIDSLENKGYFSKGLAPYFIRKLDSIGADNSVEEEKITGVMNRIKYFIDLDSTNAPLHSHLGVGYMMLGRFDLASIAFEKGVSINPNYVQMRQYLSIARTNWGAEKYQEDSLEFAIFNFKYALDYDPENQSAKDNLSATYLKLSKAFIEENNLENAYGAIAASIYYTRDNPDSYVAMGRLKMIVNQADSAEIAFNHAYRLDAQNEDAIEELIDFYSDKNDLYKAKIYSDRLKKAKRLNRKGK